MKNLIAFSLLALATCVHAAPLVAERPSAQAAAHSLKTVFDVSAPGAIGPQTGALLNYLSFEAMPAARAQDPVVAQLRAEAAEFLKQPIPVHMDARKLWSERVAVLNKLRDYLDEEQSARAQERFADMARSRRADLTSMIETATADWRRIEQGLPQEAVVAADEAPKSNVVQLTLKPKRTAPERYLFADAPVVPLPAPEVGSMLLMAKKMRDTLGWTGFAVLEHDLDARDQPLGKGESAVAVQLHGNYSMVLSLSPSGVMVGFSTRPSYTDLQNLKAAGFDLQHNAADSKVFHLYYDSALKDAGWFQRWLTRHLRSA